MTVPPCPIEHRMDTMRTFERTVNALFDDPEISGDLLAVGLWLTRATILRHPEPGDGRWSFAAVGMTLWGVRKPGSPVPAAGMKYPTHLELRTRDALRNDIPRYDPFIDNPGAPACGAPMPRAPFCRRTPMTWGFVTDPATGRRVTLGVCSRPDHRAWERQARAANTAALKAVGDHLPVPPANAGGRLQRHLRMRWERIYRRLDRQWQPPAEDTPSARPTLTVLRNDDFEPAGDTDRPELVVHKGGWH